MTLARRYATDLLGKAQLARTCNARNAPWPPWPTHDTLAVAVILRDITRLAALDSTETEALQRLRHHIGTPDLNTIARWLGDIRARLRT